MFRQTPLAKGIKLAIAVSILGAALPLAAQTPDPENDQDEEGSLERVIVTGSRIKKDAFTSSEPLVVIEMEEADLAGFATIGQLLQTSTVAAGSPQVTAATSFEFVENGGLGVQTLSLRGLGANRTLVLLNGRRAGPAGVQGGVSAFDLNVIPISAIDRVEILKDGASSIYGSDAVAGVVNIITRTDEGGTVDAFVSQPTDDGGEQSRFNASWGKDMERGSFRLTADYLLDKELARGDRDYYGCKRQILYDLETNERVPKIDPRNGEEHCYNVIWGHMWVYDYQPDGGNNPAGFSPVFMQYDYDGNLGQFVPPLAQDPDNPLLIGAPAGWFPVGYTEETALVRNDDHPFYQRKSLNPENESMTLFGDGHYDLSDNVRMYSEVLLNKRTTKTNSYSQFWGYRYNSNFDFFCGLDEGCGNPLAVGWTGLNYLSPLTLIDTKQKVEVDYTRFVLGMDGEFNNGWTWDLSGNYSHSDGAYTNQQLFDDSVSGQDWLAGSCVGTMTAVRNVPCMDIPFFDPEFMRGNMTPEMRDFLLGTQSGSTKYDQWSIDGSMSGEIMDLPAGPLGMAFGFQYRDDEIKDVPGAIVYDPETGASNSWAGAAGGITEGDDNSKAVFVEFNVPLLSGITMVDNLTLNASARYNDVDSYGDHTTWKVGLNWGIVEELRLRANYGTSFRAPALYELYLADRQSRITLRIDSCMNFTQNFEDSNISETVYQNCLADPAGLPANYSGGSINPNVVTGGGFGVLEAETSDSATIGLIWQPDFADLSLSVDYFDITVEDEIDQIGAAEIIAGCYESDFGFAFGGTEPLCQLFERGGAPAYNLMNIRDSYINIATQTNRGFDYALRYLSDFEKVGFLRVDMKVSQQVEDDFGVSEDTVEDRNGLVGDPEWVGQSDITLTRGPWEFYWGMRYVGKTSNVESYGGDTISFAGVQYRGILSTDAMTYHAFSVGYDFNDSGWFARLGIANAFDQEPPIMSSAQTAEEFTLVGTAPLVSQYDMVGRRLFFNLSYNFE